MFAPAIQGVSGRPEMRKQFSHAAALLAGAALSFQCFAQAVLAVSANVTATCLLTSGALNFIGYSGVADVQSTGSVAATCTNGSATKIMLGQGANPGTGLDRRRAAAADADRSDGQVPFVFPLQRRAEQHGVGQYDGDCQNPRRVRARADGQRLRHLPAAQNPCTAAFRASKTSSCSP
jgi:hypothetical protein